MIADAQVEVTPATADDRALLAELFHLYRYDFSEFTGEDIEADGRYAANDRLPAYFTDPDRFPFLVRVNGAVGGFALVRRCEADDASGDVTDMAEFFIMRKYRRRGVGERVATWLFDRFPGRWQVRERHNNLPAQAFWRAVIGRYTGGRYSDDPADPAILKGATQYFAGRAG